jgi:peptidoglycan L-alanyl-D-glutamate endopeptidase CwlK
MPTFGKLSLERLATCDPRLQDIAHAAIKRTDFSVACGYRGEQEQNEAFARGFSKLRFPESKHNIKPSKAMDLVPFPVNWKDIDGFKWLGKIVKEEAAKLHIKIRWGGDFVKWKDYPHFELTD